MKNIIGKLNKDFESRVRLGIMSILIVNERVEFNALKHYLDVTDGNLASHISALEKKGYIKVHKQFVGKKPNTRYEISELGKMSFKQHLKGLEDIINRE